MAIKKKKKKVVAYDPYHPYGGHSATWYGQEANRRAASDTNAAVGALPSSQFYTDSAAQLAKALGGITNNQAGVAQAGGDLYAQAFQQAAQPANKAAMVAGGQPVAGPANTSLVGALGATMAQAFAGNENAAVARGRNDVLARAGQESAIRGKQASLASDYLDKMKQEALQAGVAGFNNMLALQNYNLNASNTNFDNQLNAAQLDASIAGDQAAAGAKSSAARSKAITEARRLAREAGKSTKGSVSVGKDYTFNVPNDTILGDGSTGTQSHVVRAKDGASALKVFKAWLSSLPGYDSSVNPQNYYSGQSKDITEERVTSGSRTSQLHAALNYLLDQGFSRKEALQIARQIIGSSKLKKKSNKKTPPNQSTSSQSR